MKGAAILTEDQAKALLGNMYINVHTAKYPDGEIRGQLTPASRAHIQGPLSVIASRLTVNWMTLLR
jgi:hypothetical protein